MLLRLAIGIVCLVSCLPCQRGGEQGQRGGEQGQEETRVEEMARQRAKQAEARGEKADGGDKGDKEREENLTPEQRLARYITNGAGAHCRFLATVKPLKLMPGQSGTMLVTAVLQGHAVIPSPPPTFELVPNPQ